MLKKFQKSSSYERFYFCPRKWARGLIFISIDWDILWRLSFGTQYCASNRCVWLSTILKRKKNELWRALSNTNHLDKKSFRTKRTHTEFQWSLKIIATKQWYEKYSKTTFYSAEKRKKMIPSLSMQIIAQAINIFTTCYQDEVFLALLKISIKVDSPLVKTYY